MLLRRLAVASLWLTVPVARESKNYLLLTRLENNKRADSAKSLIFYTSLF